MRALPRARAVALGATVAALATVMPVAPQPPGPNAVTPGLAAVRAVELTAFDVVTPWLTLFDNTVNNVVSLITTVITPPAPVLQQIAANQLHYLSELPDVGAIAEQVAGNLGAAAAAPLGRDLRALDIGHALVFLALEAAAKELPDAVYIPPVIQPLVDATASLVSGVLIGLIGPILGPVIALGQSAQAIAGAVAAADLVTALNEVLNIPPTLIDAVLNGGPTLEATLLATTVGTILGVKIPVVSRVGLTMGGLLSPAGSLFNATGLSLQLTPPPPDAPIDLALKGVPVGALGSLIGLPGSVARALGWNGIGNPLKPGIAVPRSPGAPAGAARQAAPPRGAAAALSASGSAPSPAATAAPTPRRAPAGSRAARR